LHLRGPEGTLPRSSIVVYQLKTFRSIIATGIIALFRTLYFFVSSTAFSADAIVPVSAEALGMEIEELSTILAVAVLVVSAVGAGFFVYRKALAKLDEELQSECAHFFSELG
jgi:hypothetical protein